MLPPLSSLATACLALAGVLALILLGQRALRSGSFARARAGRRLAVIETVALDPRRRVQIVRCDQRSVLLLTGGAHDVVIGWLPPSESGPPDLISSEHLP